MDNFLMQPWRTGLMAGSLCLALVLGASAQSTKPQSEPAQPSATQSSPSPAEPAQTSPSQSSPSQTLPSQSAPSQNSPAQTAPGQTLPDQDNGVRPTPDKDTAPQQPATTQEPGQERGDKDRDHDRDRDTTSSRAAQGSTNISQKDVKSFDQFLDKHPDIAQDFQKDPQKVNDSTYLSSHPELSKWLDKHEKVRAELQKDPSAFMNREMKYEKNENKKPMSEQKPMSENPR
jgi:hypothetical protein